jgi:nitrate/nitrite-specific signal transduction histidine kinase
VLIADRFVVTFKKQQEAQHRYKESALALQKANEELEQRVLDRTRELSVLYDVTSVASQSLDLKTTISQCLDRVVKAMRSDVGTIHLVDESGQIMDLATTQPSPAEPLPEFNRPPTDKALKSWPQ